MFFYTRHPLLRIQLQHSQRPNFKFCLWERLVCLWYVGIFCLTKGRAGPPITHSFTDRHSQKQKKHSHSRTFCTKLYPHLHLLTHRHSQKQRRSQRQNWRTFSRTKKSNFEMPQRKDIPSHTLVSYQSIRWKTTYLLVQSVSHILGRP